MATVERAHVVVKTIMGVVPESEGGTGGEVILGASTSALCQMLALCFDPQIGPGDEIVVHRAVRSG
jgi:selenocysteine lyase/cysteine desulfurase